MNDISPTIVPGEGDELPLLGRDVANLAYLAPGVRATDSYDQSQNRYAILSVNGQGGRNVNVTINGVDDWDNTVGGPVMQLPLEAVEEFVISSQRFSAANGRSEGAAINMNHQIRDEQVSRFRIWFLPRTAIQRGERGRAVLRCEGAVQPPVLRRFRWGST